jgi:hypothetical protein
VTHATAAASRTADVGRSPERGDRTFLVVVGVLTVLLRFPSLLPLMPDESGFVLVARNWHPASDSLYGTYWVDRPPILIALFRVADAVGGAYGPRVVGAGLAVGMVLAAYRIGLLIAGRSAARWIAAACLALMSQPDFTMWSAKSESLGVPFAMVACLLVVETLHRPTRRARVVAAFGAGLTAALALGMKQSLFGPVVLVAVALALTLVTKRLSRVDAGRLGAAAAAGLALPVLAVVAWALAAGVRLGAVWETVYGFRGDAFEVITSGDMSGPLERAHVLTQLILTSGLVVVLAWFAFELPKAVRAHRELAPAVALMVVVDAVALVLSGSYWGSYALALIPGAVLALSLTASLGRPQFAVSRAIAALVAGSSVYALTVWGVGHNVGGSGDPTAHYTGEAISEAAAPGDTVLVLYGRADIVLASGLGDDYEQLWSLPMRTLDPDLAEMKALLVGAHPPTWVVEWSPADTWGLDPDGSLRSILTERYTERVSPCGVPVWLREGVNRPAFPAIDCSDHWFAWD